MRTSIALIAVGILVHAFSDPEGEDRNLMLFLVLVWLTGLTFAIIQDLQDIL